MKKLILMLTFTGFILTGAADASSLRDWSPYKSTKNKKMKRKKSGKIGSRQNSTKRSWKASI